MKKMRKPLGASMIAIALMAAFFILLPLGILGFEWMRFSVTQLQLRSICDAAALSGAVGVASTKTGWTPKEAQEQGMESAYLTFRQNVLIGNYLKDICSVNYNNGASPTDAPPGQCIVSFTLLDQNFTPVTTGDPAAKVIRCEAVYGYVPPIGQVLGFTNVPVRAFSEGGLPQLDIVMTFDISGSMDDQTPVSYVKRYWDAGTNKIVYERVSPNVSGAPAKPPQSCIYKINLPTKAGSSVNATPPQNLTYANYPRPPYLTGNAIPYAFSANLRCAPASGSNEAGAPPGNKIDPAIPIAAGSSPPVFTDIVVNLDGKEAFTGYTDPVTGLKFPDLGSLVEASRGNLDSPALMASASVAIPGVTPDPAYKATYLTLARNVCQPIAAAKQAAANFYNTMNISANCHFGFVAFADGIGTDETSTWESLPDTTPRAVDATFAQGGIGTYPLPVVKLVKADGITNVDKCKEAVGKLIATGRTDIADSILQGVNQLDKVNGLTRDKAKRTIVVFTDGIPNVPGGGTGDESSPAANAAYAAADEAKKRGIRIYAIGLSQNGEIKPTMQKILNEITKKRTGGNYYLVDKPEDLDAAFQTIAKALIVLK